MKTASGRILVVIGVAVAASCVSRRIEPARSPLPSDAALATQLVIEQFLRAANSNDLDAMARLFGTRDGSVVNRDSKQENDTRMFAIASVLRHDGYVIGGTQIVPGRRDEAIQVNVRMKFGQRQVDVPYTVVYTRDRTWLIESIHLEAITGRR
jgi:hypothetical protein